MRNLALLSFLVLVGTLAAACGSGDGTGPDDCFIDESRFRDLAVTAGTEPLLTWCGAPARSLVVERTGAGAVWAVDCTVESLCINPRVTYGDSIPNTTIGVVPQPLEAGLGYRYCVSGIDGRPPTVCLDFTP